MTVKQDFGIINFGVWHKVYVYIHAFEFVSILGLFHKFHWPRPAEAMLMAGTKTVHMDKRQFYEVSGVLTTKKWHGTPLKINMEHSDGGLEDHFPF